MKFYEVQAYTLVIRIRELQANGVIKIWLGYICGYVVRLSVKKYKGSANRNELISFQNNQYTWIFGKILKLANKMLINGKKNIDALFCFM